MAKSIALSTSNLFPNILSPPLSHAREGVKAYWKENP